MRFRSKHSGDEVLAIQWVVTGDNRDDVSKFLRCNYPPAPTMEFYMSEHESIAIKPGEWAVCTLAKIVGSPYYVASDATFRRDYEPLAERDASPPQIENQKLIE